jgi:histidyl-tRNA synthetase
MSKSFQEPKGTRDFYPDAMAVRRYIEDTWRRVSIRHGFAEVDGPTFESLDLYKVKSGDEIVSQLFHFQDRGERELALRPEFTPTLARMIAAKANALPRPIRWFSIPRCYRAEAPQKGRLREFIQWNVDLVGDGSPTADQECLAVCIDCLRELGLTEQDIRIGWNHRGLMTRALLVFQTPDRVPIGYEILDKLYKLDAHGRQELYKDKQCLAAEVQVFESLAIAGLPKANAPVDLQAIAFLPPDVREEILHFTQLLAHAGLGAYATWDVGVVRGLAYYTGFVFEVFDRVGQNRAVAGGGRYDNLIELFGGPPMPAIGFGMGDVVLEILLREKNRLPANLMPRPAAFVVNALEDSAPAIRLLAALRTSVWAPDRSHIARPGLHAITSAKATKNIGKLLQDAASSGARFAIILAPAEMARGVVKLKDLTTRQEGEVPATQIVEQVHLLLRGG